MPLYITSVIIAIFIDAIFTTNDNSSSQLGFLICVMDKFNYCNIIHYSSSKSRRVCRGALAAELFTLVNGFDYSSTMRLDINEMFGREIPLNL